MAPSDRKDPKVLRPSVSLEELAAQYTKPLRRYFRRKLPLSADSDDLVQEVFVRLAKLDDFSNIENPQAYIFQIATNLLKDKARQDVSHQSSFHETYEDDVHGYMAITPEVVLIGKQNLAQLKQLLLELPTKTQSVFVLHRFDGLKYREIAELLNMSISSVEKHMMKALEKLTRGVTRL